MRFHIIEIALIFPLLSRAFLEFDRDTCHVAFLVFLGSKRDRSFYQYRDEADGLLTERLLPTALLPLKIPYSTVTIALPDIQARQLTSAPYQNKPKFLSHLAANQ